MVWPFRWNGRRHCGTNASRKYNISISSQSGNNDLHETYQRLLNAGKARKVAVTAVMRRIVVLANTLLRETHDWLPERP